MISRILKYHIWFFPVMALLLAGLIVALNLPVFKNHDAVMYLYLKNAAHGRTGYGSDGYYGNDISLAGLEPGDLILGGYPDCAYGRFSHAGIYLGDGKVMEGFVDLGVNIQPLEHYRQYQEVCLLRINAGSQVKAQAVESTMKYEGRMFYPLAFKPGTRWFNCSKIMWLAYREQGIDLAPAADFWISPDAFYYSPVAEVIREKKAQ